MGHLKIQNAAPKLVLNNMLHTDSFIRYLSWFVDKYWTTSAFG
jgi:hypothetical protein